MTKATTPKGAGRFFYVSSPICLVNKTLIKQNEKELGLFHYTLYVHMYKGRKSSHSNVWTTYFDNVRSCVNIILKNVIFVM